MLDDLLDTSAVDDGVVILREVPINDDGDVSCALLFRGIVTPQSSVLKPLIDEIRKNRR
jgi:hypothetical protein